MKASRDATAPERAVRILAIRLARLGDVALLLPALNRLKSAFPAAHLTLATGLPYAPLGDLCPFIDDVIAIDRLAMRDGPKPRALRDIARLIRDIRVRRFDLVVDFHSFRETNLLAWTSGAPRRLGMKRSDRPYLAFCFNMPPVREDKGLHVARMFERVAEGVPEVAGVPRTGPIPLVVPPDRRPPRPEGRGVVALYVGASARTRRWPAARFAAVAAHAARAWDAEVWVLAGASEEEATIARRVLDAVEEDERRVRVLSGLPIADLVGAIGSADLLVSNDTGPMHLGSALGVPTLGIFSESLPLHYQPVGANDRYVRKESVDAVEVSEVVGLMAEMWLTASRGRRP